MPLYFFVYQYLLFAGQALVSGHLSPTPPVAAYESFDCSSLGGGLSHAWPVPDVLFVFPTGFFKGWSFLAAPSKAFSSLYFKFPHRSDKRVRLSTQLKYKVQYRQYN